VRGFVLACPRLTHGLGNRVRLVMSSRVLARLEGRSFCYAWPTGEAFGAELTDLWEFDERQVPAWASTILARWYPYRDERLAWIDDSARRSLLWQIRSAREVVLAEGAGDWRRDFGRLTPAASVADAVRAFFAARLAGAPYVGVMVRSHAVSHRKTREHSPVEWFISRMAEIARAQSDVRFFLACDDPAVQETILARFPTCVAQSDKGAYNSRRAVKAAVSDLYLLASSAYLLGPYWSSFVHLARYLSDRTVPVETSRTGRPADWRKAGNLGVVADPVRPSEVPDGLTTDVAPL
jgi:hypothetical protein